MFTSKGMFREVACPFQSTCTLPNCLFWHPDGSTPVQIKVIPATAALGDENRPLKRRKLEDPQSDLAKQLPLGPEVETLSLSDFKVSQGSGNGKGLQRTSHLDSRISPPPVRPKVQLLNTSKGISTPVKHLSSPTPVTPVVKSTPTIKESLKTEVLNPRTLKGPSPSTFAIRWKLIQLLHDQLNRLNSELKNDANDEEEKLVLSDQELIKKTLDFEETAAGTPSIYSNVVKGKIGAYKKMTIPQWKEERNKEIAALKAPKIGKATDVLNKPQGPPKVVKTGITTEEELKILPRLYSSLEGLEKHGYVTDVPTESEISSAKQGVEAAKGWEVCDRCKNRFQVFPGRREDDGALASGGICTYHYGRSYLPERSTLDPRGKREKRYRCCNQLLGDSLGCTKAECHVFKISEVKRMASVLNFQRTPENPERVLSRPVCIDGEMGYTVYGLELIRLTATSWPTGEELFDVLVRPVGEIMDLNSRFSGIWPKDYAEANPYDTPPDLFAPPTPSPTTSYSKSGERSSRTR